MAEPDIQEDTSQDEAFLDTPLIQHDDPSVASDEPDKGEEQTAETKDEDEADGDAKDTEATSDESSDESQSDEQTEDKGKPDPEKARNAYQERQQRRQQVESMLNETYAPQSAEQLVEQGMDENRAEIEALRQEMQFNQQRAQIAELNSTMQQDAVNVQNDFDVFNPKSPDYDEDFASQVSEAYQQAARLQKDDNGVILNADLPIYDYYQRMAEIYNRGVTKGTSRGQAEYQQMQSKAENPGGSSSTNRGDSLTDLEERIGDVSLA